MTPQADTRPAALIDYGPQLEAELAWLIAQVERYDAIRMSFPARWLALQLLEQDEALGRQLSSMAGGKDLLVASWQSLDRLAQTFGEDVDTLIAERRYRWINEVVGETVEKPAADGLTRSDKVDRIVTHKVWGIPIFLGVMWTAFKLTTEASVPYLNWIDTLISGPLSRWLTALMEALGLGQTWLHSLLVDGVLAGVGGVLVFVPVLIFLYLVLALLEASGYMARAAFVMDRLMQALGLQGKSFLPMLVGFGCNVPAIYATRTLDNEKDRILTGLLVPFMSCGARLPVYVLVATIFFPAYSGSVVFGMYLLGVLAAIGAGLLLRRTLFRRAAPSALLMELPPYRLPGWKSLWTFTWARTAAFVRNAGTLILAASVVLWGLLAVPANDAGRFAQVAVDDSAFAALAAGIAPAFSPLGFGQWEASGALLAGFVAKEVVVSTLAQVYQATEAEITAPATSIFEDLVTLVSGFGQATLDTLKSMPRVVGIDLFEPETHNGPTPLMASLKDGFESASQGHGALAGLAFMVFVLLYTPCIAALAAERHELGARWMGLSIGGQLLLAWAAAFAVFQGGKLLGLG